MISLPTSPAFRRLWGAHAISVVGDAMTVTTLIIWVYEVGDRRASWVSAVVIAGFLPPVLAGLLLGGLADRWDRRRLMVSADVLRVLVGLAMAGFVFLGWPAPVLTCLAVMTGAGAVFAAAQRAAVPHTVPADQLQRANAIVTLTRQVSFVFGPAAAGTLILSVGPVPAVLFDSATFGASALLLRGMIMAERAASPGSRMSVTAVGPAVRAMLACRPVLLATGAATLLAASAGTNNTVMVLFLDQDLGGQPTDVAWLSAANGLAQLVAGGGLIVFANRLPVVQTIPMCVGVIAAFSGALALAPTVPFAIGAVVGIALANAPFAVSYTTLRQTSIDDAVLARVFAASGALASAMFLAGSLGGAWLADNVNGRTSLLVSAVCTAGAAAWVLPLLRSPRHSAPKSPDAVTQPRLDGAHRS